MDEAGLNEIERRVDDTESVGNPILMLETETVRKLIQAARLVREIHHEADIGVLDGVDLDWMVRADKLLN